MKNSTVIAIGLGALVIASPYFSIPGWTISLATVAAITALALIGLNLIFGVAGMLAFGQAAFISLPGYSAGVLEKFGMPVVPGLICGLVITLIIARVLAEIFVRLPGVYFAVGTLGFGFVVEGLARAFPAWTGGASGLVFSIGRGIDGDTWYAIAVVCLLGGLTAISVYLRGATWRRLRTIRHDELAAATLGIDVTREKARVFTIGSAFAAFAGILMVSYVGVLVPESAGVSRSLEQIGTVMLGGAGSILGPVVGSVFIQWLFVVAGFADRFELLIYGVVFLAAVMYAREGIVGLVRPAWRMLAARIDGPATIPSPPPDANIAAMTQAGSIGRGGDTCLTISRLSKNFGGLQALSDVSFDVRHGEIFTLVGPNGAGKSTLFNIISGIETPTSGTVSILGNEVHGSPIHRRAHAIGRSFQVARLVPELTVLENIVARLDQTASRLGETQRLAEAARKLTGFDLQHLSRRPVRELSLGQHKLVDIVRATIGDPPLLLLDEPAVGLTGEELVHLKDLMMKLSARGSAIVIVEHNIDFVADVSSRGIVLDSGRMISMGAIDHILSDPKVRDAYFGALA